MGDAQAALSTPYDEIPYPTAVNPYAHPETMAVLARLYGLEPAPIETCRVLEVGCGDGGNLIPMAATSPKASFHGFDLAPSVIARGQADIAALGLENIRLEAADVLEVAERNERYDYIIAHGFYTWVPEVVRQGLLRLLENALTPGGLVFVSYNLTQGCHVRRMMREAIQFQMRLTGVDRSDRKGVANCIHFLAGGPTDGELYSKAMKAEAQRWQAIGPEVALHDILSPDYATFRFHEVAERFAAHGLDYVGEADSYALRRELFPGDLDREVHRRAGGDGIAIEEVYDDLYARAFRMSVFRRREPSGPPWRRPTPTPKAVAPMHLTLSTEVTSDNIKGEEKDGQWRLLVGARDGVRVQLAGDGLHGVIQRLLKIEPGSVPASEFGDAAQAGPALTLLHSVGIARLLTRPSPATGEVSARPRAFAPAALLASRGARRLPRADHTEVAVDPAPARLLTLLDGERSHEEIAAAAAEMFGTTVEAQTERLPDDLKALAKSGVLVS